jgi:MFS family permease
MTGTLAPLFGVALGASPASIGVVISAAFLFPFFLAVPVGTVVDAIGPKPMLLLGTALLAIAPVGVAVVPSFPSLLVAQVLAGLGQLIAVVAAQAMVAPTFKIGTSPAPLVPSGPMDGAPSYISSLMGSASPASGILYVSNPSCSIRPSGPIVTSSCSA